MRPLNSIEKLKQYGCDDIQRYLFSRPIPADEFVNYYRFMKSGRNQGAI